MTTPSMTTHIDISLAEQRELIRRQIHAQRLVIAEKLEEHPAQTSGYRSMVMRFLTQQSGAKIAAEVATLALGTRMLKYITSALALAKIIKNVTPKA